LSAPSSCWSCIGGGFSLAAVAGTRELLEQANPRNRGPGYVYISGTLNGNPIAAAAGLATLEQLRLPGTYERLQASGDRLRQGLRDLCTDLHIPAQVLGVASMLNLYFTDSPIHDYRTARTENGAMKEALGRKLLQRGVITNLGAKLYVSSAHSDELIDHTIAMVRESLEAIAADLPGV
jgi:glutamate-1-semialdehyde 2,1-aminomutase